MDIEDEDNLHFIDLDSEENEEYDEEAFGDERVRIVSKNKSRKN